jgi:hypothetical protein
MPGSTRKTPVWTKQDSEAARLEGWDLFHVYIPERKKYVREIQFHSVEVMPNMKLQTFIGKCQSELHSKAHLVAFRSKVDI